MVTVSLKTPDMMCTAHKWFADPTLRTTGSEQIIHCVCARISGGRDFNAWSLQRPHLLKYVLFRIIWLEWRSWFDPCGRSSYIFHDRLASKMGVLCQKNVIWWYEKKMVRQSQLSIITLSGSKISKIFIFKGEKKKRWMHIIISY